MMIREPAQPVANQYYVIYNLTTDAVVVTENYQAYPHRLMLWSFDSNALATGWIAALKNRPQGVDWLAIAGPKAPTIFV
jgi:hypothetical protein